MSEDDRPRQWLRVSDHAEIPAGQGSPRVDLFQCRTWIREAHWCRFSRQLIGQDCLARTPGERWFVYTSHFRGEFGWGRAWWVSRGEAVEWFLRNPSVEPPADLRAELDGFDATNEPAPASPRKPIEAPAEPEPIQAPPIEAPAASSPVDFAMIASELRKARRVRQAQILEMAIGKTELEAEDVAFQVHGRKRKPKPTPREKESRDKTIRGNLDRLNGSLEDMGIPLRFQLAGNRVTWETIPA